MFSLIFRAKAAWRAWRHRHHQHKRSTLVAQILSAEQHISELERTNANLRRSNAGLRTQLGTLDQQLDALINYSTVEGNEKDRKIAELTFANEDLEAPRIATLAAERDGQNARAQVLREDHIRQYRRIEDLEDLLDEAEGDVEERDARIEGLLEVLDEGDRRVYELDNFIGGLRGGLAASLD
ncbi:MAG: hypothetical protein Q9218_007503 [Villophora microphyllina]